MPASAYAVGHLAGVGRIIEPAVAVEQELVVLPFPEGIPMRLGKKFFAERVPAGGTREKIVCGPRSHSAG